jgi:cell division protein FtsQ
MAATTADRPKSLLAAAAEVRLINGVALAVGLFAAATLLAAAGWWVIRAPWWTIRAVELHGDLQRNSAATLRANTLPRLQGTFLTLDLARARAVFESVPWVRRAVVRRVWPNRLSVTIEEHRPVARWLSADGIERLVNNHGEVFEGSVGEAEGETLPAMSGPDGSAPRLMAMHRELQAQFELLQRRVVQLELSGRGSWSLVLDNDATVQLGRGERAEVLARTGRFVSTVSQVTGNFRAPLASADLRHAGGYAVRLSGVTMVDEPVRRPGRQ